MQVPSLVESGLNELALPANQILVQQLYRYQELLLRWNRTTNLTSIIEPKRIITHHIFDALSVHPFIVGQRVLDVGSGAGLPGIPLALINPDKDFILLDSNGKKTRFMTQVKIELGLGNVTIIKSRVEDYNDLVDQVISRAFAGLKEFAYCGLRLLGINGSLLAMKGPNYANELKGLHYSHTKVHPLFVPSLDVERYLIEITVK